MPGHRSVFRALFATLLLTIVSACAGTNAAPGSAAYQPTVYRLAAGDQLSITVFGEENLSREYSVTPQGDLAFPLLGDIPVANQTVGDLQQLLRDRLAEGYLNDPRVTVEVLNYRPFYILGEVNNAGEYPFKNGLTVVQAVAQAPQGVAHRRLGQVEHLGGAGQRALGVDGIEDHEQIEIEARHMHGVYL